MKPTNGRVSRPATQPTRWTYRRLALAGALLLVVGGISAATGFPFARGGDRGVPLNSLAAVDARTGKITARLAVGVRPQAVVVGDGAVWVANTTDRTVSRIGERGAQLEQTIPVGVYPSDLAVAGGSVLVSSAPLGQLVTIAPATNGHSEPEKVTPACAGVRGSMTTGQGSLWLVCERVPAAFRVQVAGSKVRFADRGSPIQRGTPQFSAIAVGLGRVWITDRAHNDLLEVDARSLSVLRRIGVGSDPTALAVGFGSVWVANWGGGTVSRVEPGLVTQTIRVGQRPIDVAVGNGAVWVANAGSDSVSRIDPQTSSVTRTITLHNPPAGIAAADGRVWVTVAEE